MPAEGVLFTGDLVQNDFYPILPFVPPRATVARAWCGWARAAGARDGEVLVQVQAAGVAFADLLLREGLRRVPLPAVPGHEAAGMVIATGPHVDGLAVGDTVAV